MPNVMAAQPNTGGALCESSTNFIPCTTPPSLADAYGAPCSNTVNIGECKTGTQSELCTWQNSVKGTSP